MSSALLSRYLSSDILECDMSYGYEEGINGIRNKA